MVLELLKLRTGLPVCSPEFVACIGVLGVVGFTHWSHFGPVKRFGRRDHAASLDWCRLRLARGGGPGRCWPCFR
jgi:hypothetical protein